MAGMASFATLTAANAHVYSAYDVNKLIRVDDTGSGSPGYYYITAVSGGVATLFAVGGGSVSFGSVTGLTVGGGNVNGAASTAARSDHVHALPAFGTTAGTFAQGNDARFPGSTLANIWDPDIPFASPSSYDDEFNGTNGSTTGWTTFDNPAGSSTSATNSMDGSGRWVISQAAQGSFKPVGAFKVLSNTTLSAFLRARFIGAFAGTCSFCFFLGERSAAGAWTTSDGYRGVRFDFPGTNTYSDSAALPHIQRIRYEWQTATNMGTNGGSSVGNRILGTSQDAEVIIRLRLDNSATSIFGDSGPGYSGRGYQFVDHGASVVPSAFKAIGWWYAYQNSAPSNADPTVPRVELDWVRVDTSTAASNAAVGRLVTKYYT